MNSEVTYAYREYVCQYSIVCIVSGSLDIYTKTQYRQDTRFYYKIFDVTQFADRHTMGAEPIGWKIGTCKMQMKEQCFANPPH